MENLPVDEANWWNWKSFSEALWRFGPGLLENVPPEMKWLIHLLVEDPSQLDFYSDSIVETLDDLWSENPREGVQEALQVWAEGVQDVLLMFGHFEVDDAYDWEDIKPLIYEISVMIDEDVVSKLVEAASKPIGSG